MEKLNGPWEQLFEELTTNCETHKGSELAGFKEAFSTMLEESLLTKQQAGASIGLQTTALMIEECRKGAIRKLRASFSERLDRKTIVEVIRDSTVNVTPGETTIAENITRRHLLVFLGLETNRLSDKEVQYMTDACENMVELDLNEGYLCIKCYKYELEGPEPTEEENICVSNLAKKARPNLVHYVNTNFGITWKEFASDVFITIKKATTNKMMLLVSKA